MMSTFMVRVVAGQCPLFLSRQLFLYVTNIISDCSNWKFSVALSRIHFFASRIINFPVINLFPLCCQIWPLCLFIFISGLKAIQLILLQMNKKRWASLNLVFIKYLYWECLTTWFQDPIDLLQLCFCSSTSTAHIYFFKFWSIFFICSWQDDDDYSTTIMHPSRNTYTAPTALLNDIARSSENVSTPQQCLSLVSNLFIIL